MLLLLILSIALAHQGGYVRPRLETTRDCSAQDPWPRVGWLPHLIIMDGDHCCCGGENWAPAESSCQGSLLAHSPSCWGQVGRRQWSPSPSESGFILLLSECGSVGLPWTGDCKVPRRGHDTRYQSQCWGGRRSPELTLLSKNHSVE